MVKPPRVLVVRARAQATRLAERLKGLGCEVVLCPLIAIEPLEGGVIDTRGYDWLVVTSPNGADELARRLDRGTLPRVAAIGPGTAEALESHCIEPDLVPAVATQEGLLAELPRPPGRILLAAAEGARRFLVDELGATFLPLYRTVELHPADLPDADIVVLASASQARAFAALELDLPAVSIGPQTSDTARRLGLRVVAEARSHDLDGLVAAVRAALHA